MRDFKKKIFLVIQHLCFLCPGLLAALVVSLCICIDGMLLALSETQAHLSSGTTMLEGKPGPSGPCSDRKLPSAPMENEAADVLA